MRFVPINCIRDGMVIGRQLIGKNGELLLNRGSLIQTNYIQKLNDLGFSGIYIDDDISKDIEISEIISESLRHKAVKAVKDIFIDINNNVGPSAEKIRNINELVGNIVEDVLASRDIMANMIDLKVFDDYTFYHSTNVAVLSLMVGISLDLDKNQLYKLGLAAILHDIGKVFIPKEVLNKPGKLNAAEFNIIASHSYKGYEYLKDKFDIPTLSYIGVLHHHEKFDGTGYPMKAKGTQISLFGRIISVADVYDALTSRRPYRDAMIPSEAIEYIMAGGSTMFDSVITKCFIQRVAPFPIGTCVRLSNNKAGIVVKNYIECSMRPRIKIISHGGMPVVPYFVDLKVDMSALDVTIVGIENKIVF